MLPRSPQKLSPFPPSFFTLPLNLSKLRQGKRRLFAAALWAGMLLFGIALLGVVWPIPDPKGAVFPEWFRTVAGGPCARGKATHQTIL